MEEKIWHKSYAPGVPFHLDFEQVTIPQALTRTAQHYGDKVALSFPGQAPHLPGTGRDGQSASPAPSRHWASRKGTKWR